MPHCKEYVNVVPLPGSSHSGIRINARNLENYTLSEPNRDVVRKENFTRREFQKKECGFSSVSWKPYKGIGYPFHLKPEDIILDALGQYTKNDDPKESTKVTEKVKEKPTDPIKYTESSPKEVNKSNYKNLKTLNKEVKHAKYIIKNVSLGHQLFNFLKNEKLKKDTVLKLAAERNLLLQRTQCKPPKNMDLDSNSNKDNCMKLKRPYTAKSLAVIEDRSTNISPEDNQDSCDMSNSIFRQICVLMWLLDSMANENIFTPVTNCWNLRNLNSKTEDKPIEKIESDWKVFRINCKNNNSEREIPRRDSRIYNQAKADISTISTDRKIISRTASTHSFVKISNNIRKATESLRNWKDEDMLPIKHSIRKSSCLRADRNVKSNTSAIEKYEMQASSNIHKHLTSKLRDKFSDIKAENQQIINDSIEIINRERYRKMQMKFLNMPVEGYKLNETLRHMRGAHSNNKPNKITIYERRRSSIHKQWFVDLEYSIMDLFQDSEIKYSNVKEVLCILKERYGMMHSVKQTCFQFRRVLEHLRLWELQTPDISAAVEFCRNRIIEMPAHEYAEWFCERFAAANQERLPTRIRPITAPC